MPPPSCKAFLALKLTLFPGSLGLPPSTFCSVFGLRKISHSKLLVVPVVKRDLVRKI